LNVKSRVLKRLGWILFWVFILHFIVEVTGHHYIYNTLSSTVFEGRLGPGILEYKDMPNRVIETGDAQPWKISSDYNAASFNEEELSFHEEFGTVSFLVIKNDEIVFEEYWDDFDLESISNSFSMAKSVVGVLTGIAIKKGQIESVDKPAYWYLPQYESDLGEKMTIRHLLTMSSGINFDESYINPFSFPARANYGDNLELLLRNYEVTEEPDEYFNYQSGGTQVLAFALKSVTRTSLSEYASENLWKPLGAEHEALWSLDHEGGTEKAFCCINATARDFARIGKLYLNNGRWNGVQIVDSAYVAASVSQQQGLKNEDGSQCEIYGYSWWLGEHKSKYFYMMRGILGQYVIVIPEDDIIVVRMGHKRKYGSGIPHPEDVFHYIDMAQRLTAE
jgi:CubicO group peptidase (beta-lactamase class C family)